VNKDCDGSEFDSTAVNFGLSGDGLLSWNIDNWFATNITWIQMVYKGADGSVQSSGRVPLLSSESTADYTSMCNGGWTSIDLYVAQSATVPENKNVCTGWDPESDICRYKIELSCGCPDQPGEPTSGPTFGPTSSPAPTVCREIELLHEEPLIDWPLDAGPELVALNATTGTVTVVFNQTFDIPSDPIQGNCAGGQIDWMAFVYDDVESNSTCSKLDFICYGESFETTVECGPEDEYTTLTVYVYDDHASFSSVSNASPGACASWWTDGGTNVAKYIFEVPCNSEPCQDREIEIETTPTPPPTPPAGEPTSGPTSGPTTGPTAEICIDDPLVELDAKIGLGSVSCNGTVIDFADNDLPIEVIDRSDDGENVTFRIDQLFYSDTIAKMAVHHRYNKTSSECDFEDDVEYGWNDTYTAQCFMGEAHVTVYLYLCGYEEEEECDYCQRQENMTNFMEYSFSLSCLPPCPPDCPPIAEPECLEDVELVDPVGVTEYDRVPIRILDQNTSTVTFTVDNSLGVDIDNIFVQYHNTAVGDTTCDHEQGVSVCGNNVTFTAYCMSRTPVTIVDLWIVDDSLIPLLDNAVVPDCCEPEEYGVGAGPKVQYSFLIHCKSVCDEEEPAVRLLSPEDRANAMIGFYKSSHRSKSSSPLEIAAKGGHYCSKEDHPCGANNENVHVCHYSARDGYQTFCVPEDDTDILAYYPKDHCGPCFGGFAKPAP
jgi:hypothetical protein